MSMVPIRLRVTLAFAAVMALVLVAVGLILYLRLASQLDESVNSGLASRAADAGALARESSGRLGSADEALVESEESFAQILSSDGRVIDSTPQVAGASTVDRGQLARAEGSPQTFERESVPGIEGRVRLVAAPVGGGTVVVVGTSLGDRDEALASLATLLAIGGPVTLLLASLAGYWAAGAALRPVERMRSRAAQISVTAGSAGERLPVPPAGDELTRLGETLNAMLERLDAALARERRFVDDASHELRTPLALHRIELELALRQDGNEADLRRSIASAIDEVDSVIALAEDLLVVARTEDGRVAIEPARFAASEALTSVRDRFQQRAGRSGTVIEVESPAGIFVEADRSRVEQALTNLVDNALRHAMGPIEIEASRSAGEVELHVSDHGPGFPPGFIDHAFERFSRADEARASDGTGLGLAIVEAVARAHGGEARASNRVGGGADVWITVPAAD